MRIIGQMERIATVLVLSLLLAGMADAHWDSAVLEQLTAGPDYDMLGRNALVIDDKGTLHLVYSSGMGEDSHLFYMAKPVKGDWTAPEPIGDHNLVHGLACWIDLGPQQKKQYVLFSEDYVLTLGIRDQGQWEYHSLETPYDWPYQNPALAVDPMGNAHVAMVFHNPTGSMHHIGYGYWDGTPDFHCQIFDDFTALEDAGLWAQPELVAKPDGSVVLTYRSLYQWSTVELIIASNSSLGGTDWAEEVIHVPGDVPGFTGYFVLAPNGDLHYTFTTNMYWQFAKEMFYIMQPAGSAEWTAPVKICEGFYGIFPKLAVDRQGYAHVVAQETSGMHSTGNLLYFTNETGAWTQSYLLEGLWENPSFVIDRQGNGNVVCTDEVNYIDDFDIYYYGFVAKPKQKMAVDPTPPSFKKR